MGSGQLSNLLIYLFIYLGSSSAMGLSSSLTPIMPVNSHCQPFPTGQFEKKKTVALDLKPKD